jgi:hypothetical protein
LVLSREEDEDTRTKKMLNTVIKMLMGLLTVPALAVAAVVEDRGGP